MKNSFLALLVILLSGCRTYTTSSDPENQPNILFILSDDHTSQAWGIYGGILKDYAQNNHIERIAKEGAILQNVFCTNSICVPSRGSILTGQYSHRNGIYTLSDPLDPDSMHIAKSLQQAGYETAIIGKWHLHKQPNGFDYYHVLPGQGVYHNPVLRDASNWPDGKKHSGYSSDVIGDLSVDWLEKRKDSDKPFFLMTHFKATHEPFDYPDRHTDFLKDVNLPEPASIQDWDTTRSHRMFIGQQLDILGERYVQDSKRVSNRRYPGPPFTLEGLSRKEARQKTYQKFIKDFLRGGAAINDNIGKLLDFLDRNHLTENTIVIYTADQGYFLGEHGFFDKRMMYEEALRMPFVIRYPDEIPAGTQNADMILNIDFPALFADYAGLDVPEYIQGNSFRKNLVGQTPSDWRTQMYYRYWLHQQHRPAHFGLRTQDHKLIFYYGQPLDMTGAEAETSTPGWEFYDLKTDPNENHNVYRDPSYRELIDSLKTDLLSLKKQVGDSDQMYPLMSEIFDAHW